ATSRIDPRSLHHGSETSATSTGTQANAKMRLAAVPRSILIGSMSIPRAREQPARPDDENDQERDMPGQDLPGRRQRGPDRLRDAKHHAAEQRAPQIAEAADDDRFERKDEPDRSGRRIEVRADSKEDAGNSRENHRDPERHCK